MDVLIDAFYNFVFFLGNILLLGSLLVVLALALRFLISEFTFKKEVEESLSGKDRLVLSAKVPPSNEQKADAMESFLLSLHRVWGSPKSLSLEMTSSQQFLHFYIVIPKNQKNILESQLYAQYPDAEIEEAEDYLLQSEENTAFAEIGFKHSSINPLKTYEKMEEDLLKNLSALLSKAENNETAVIQIVLKKIGSKPWQRGLRVLYFKIFNKDFSPENPTSVKLSQELYRGKIRVSYTADSRSSANAKLESIVNLFKGAKGENELKKKRPLIPEDMPKSFKARAFQGGDLWSPSEIATIYHFPFKGNIVSNVVRTTSKKAPSPDNLPVAGLVDEKEVSFFGETNYRNDRRVFGIKREDRRRHLYIVGKTGSGKSKLLELLFISDIQQGEGCCLIDPHGDLADELLKFIPKERIADTIYINPTDRDFPIGFNPLEPVENYEERQHLARFFISTFKKLFAENWNSRMEHLVRYITLALLETPDSSILGIPRMLSDVNFRQNVIKQIQDPVVKSFWTNEFSTANEQFISVAAVPILNKLGQFISNPIIRNMVGQRKNTLDFEKFMNEGKIVIINLSKGKLGEDNAMLLGSMFITKIQQAALSRARMEEEKRRDFYFYVDEFQNFATDAFSSILSEARKYRLDLTIAHQYIAQLPEDVKATAFGNVGSIIVFPVGGDDAAYLAKEFTPIFTPDDMINLNVREVYIKMSVDGKVTPPFSARTIDVSKPEFDYSNEVVDKTRLKYGKNRVSVENEIARWGSATESVAISSEEGFPEPII